MSIPAGLCQCGCGLPTPLATHTRLSGGRVKGQPTKYRRGHHTRPIGPEYVVNGDGCWVWQRGKSDGYGIGWRPATGQDYAHRIYYRELVGPIPSGLQLDHLCRNRACVNPAHLEPVTCTENLRRGEGPSARNGRKRYCKHGHPLGGDNLYHVNGKRHCRMCQRARNRTVWERDKRAYAAARDAGYVGTYKLWVRAGRPAGHTDGGILVSTTYGHPADAGARARNRALWAKADGPRPLEQVRERKAG